MWIVGVVVFHVLPLYAYMVLNKGRGEGRVYMLTAALPGIERHAEEKGVLGIEVGEC